MVEIDQNKSTSIKNLDPREEGRTRPKLNDELQKIQIGVVAKMFTFIRQGLAEAMKVESMSLLRKNLNHFV